MVDDKGQALTTPADAAQAAGGHVHKCPLCEGRGELPEKQLFDRLAETDLGRKLASYVANVADADEKAKATGKSDFQRHVDHWNCTHFLWRRSPKE